MSEPVLISVVPYTPVVSRDMLSRLDVNGPRYTSYPTADRFVEAYGPANYRQALQQRAQGGGVIGGAQRLFAASRRGKSANGGSGSKIQEQTS